MPATAFSAPVCALLGLESPRRVIALDAGKRELGRDLIAEPNLDALAHLRAIVALTSDIGNSVQRAHLTGDSSPRLLKEHKVIDIDPNTDGLPGIEQLRVIVGAAMTVGLILAVLALIISAVIWGYGANSSNPHLASRGKIGVLVSCGAAIICGASVTLVNFFWNVGQSV